MVTALTRVENGIEREAPFITPEKVQLLKDTLLKGATDLELQLFVTQCEKRRLDPFTRQFYGIKTGGGLQMFASIDGLRVIAQRSGEYRGQVGPFWCGTDGQWADVWLAQEPPSAAKVGVLRSGWTEPLWGVATFKSYGAGKQSPVWRTMPDVMLAKAAEALALRKAFPDDMSGIYTPEEIEHDPPKHDRHHSHVVTEPVFQPVYEGLGPNAQAQDVERELADDDIIDADPETGEIVQESFVPPPVQAAAGRMTKEQSQLIKDIAGQLGLDPKGIGAFSSAVTGISNPNLLREDQAKDLLEHMLAELRTKGVMA